jgi:hypothetical protein
MWDDAREQLEVELDASERWLWSGRPRQGLLLRPSDAYLIPFSLLWGGFAIFWECSVIIVGAPTFFWVWGIPFVLVGLYLIVGRFWADARMRAKTYYGVTNERVLIVSGVFRRRIQSFDLATISDLSLSERGGRTGTISLGPSSYWLAWYGGGGWPMMNNQRPPLLDSIHDARSVYETIRRAQRAAKALPAVDAG